MSAAALADRDAEAGERLRAWLRRYQRVFVLTGAGVSTASGIPDYRGPDGLWKRRAPITYQAFVRDSAMRARYWARSFAGWPVVAGAQPNRAHAALVALERRNRLALLVTQNVDGLHARAGQRTSIDLHGCIDRVICLHCAARTPRAAIQQRLAEAYPHWSGRIAAAAPDGDGDADLEPVELEDFQPPRCACGGLLKPDVVFFGENVPRERVDVAQAALATADAMLVVGSSLMVYSGYRLARQAREADLPLAILTRGITRADALATLKLDADCVPVLAGALQH